MFTTTERLLVSLRQWVRGFLLIPMFLSLIGAAGAVGAVYLDRSIAGLGVVESLSFLKIEASGARTVLSTIAGAMMTVLSLVYSLTLVVFTLAASNIGPRLLETFTDNRVNQTTIGLLGATFLYSLIVLYIVGEQEVPKVSVAIAISLAAVSFFWLVYFVHDVARRVMVDNEIGRTQRAVRKTVQQLLIDEPRESPGDRERIPEGDRTPIKSRRSGYVRAVDAHRLIHVASKADGFIEMHIRPGEYVIEGMAIASLIGDQGGDGTIATSVCDSVLIGNARAPEGDIQFSVHLGIEIAMRALSPGVNDAYTAIGAIDHLSGSLALILQRGAPSSLLCDDRDVPRLWLEILSVKDIVGAALHPLRRASRGNLMVILKLVEAINRMAEVVRPEHAHILLTHLRLIVHDNRHCLENKSDRSELAGAAMAARACCRLKLS